MINMGDPPSRPRSSTSSSSDTPSPPPPPPSHSQSLTLIQPSSEKKHRAPKLFRVFRNVCCSFPNINPAACKLPSLPGGSLPDSKSSGGDRITGTLFGYRKGRVSLSLQENPRTLPMLVVELAMLTHVLQKELSQGLLRITLECEKSMEKERQD